jgi:toxin ParE1/3/4
VYSVIFTQAARTELVEAQDWYEAEAAGLGRQFPTVFRNVRRALLRRFPYSLFFVVEDETLIVIACFHASRDPAHWQKRT